LINTRNLLVYGAAAAAIGYVFSIASGSIGLIMLLAFWLLNYKELNFKELLKRNSLYLLILFFLILLLEISYSIDLKQGKKDIIRHLAFVIYPLVFITIKPFTTKERLVIIKIFIHSLSIFFIVCLITAIVRQIGFWQRGGIFNWYYFYRYDFLEVFRQHPTYLSIYTLLSLSFLSFRKKLLFRRRWLFYGSLLLQISALILYGSRMGYLLFLVLMTVYFSKNILGKKGREKVRTFVLYILGLVVLFFILLNIPIVKERIFYTIGVNYNYKFNNQEFIEDKTPEEQGRLLLWQDALDLIKERPLLGYGTGSSRKVLIEKYKQEGHTLFLENLFNAHNTYIETMLIGGIPLLLAFLSLVMSLFYKAAMRKDIIVFYFAAIVAMVSFTETIFLAQGILFLSFFYCFLLTKTNE